MIDFIYSVDKAVFLWIYGLSGHVPFIDGLMKLITNDIFMPMIIFLILIAMWFASHDQKARELNQRAVFSALLSMGISNIIVKICNILYDRPRPYDVLPNIQTLFHHSDDSSFPSNMAAVFFAVAMGVWIYNRKLGWWLFIPAVLVSFSRIYVGIHYPLDIVGAFFTAMVSTGIAFLVLKVIEPLPTKVIKLMRKIYLA